MTVGDKRDDTLYPSMPIFFERVPESPQQFLLLLLRWSGPPASGGGGNLEVGEWCSVSSRGEHVQLMKPA